MQLPIKVPPFSGELLSSWVTRLANNNQMTVSALLVAISQEKLIQSDFDRSPPFDFISSLASTGMSLPDEKRLERAAITSWAEKTGSIQQCMRRWILPAGHRHPRIRFCAQCLMERPYYRKVWRLSWYGACHKHKSLLSDRCHNCGAAQVLQRTAWRHGIGTCTNCQVSLCAALQVVFSDQGYWETMGVALRRLRSFQPTKQAEQWFSSIWTISNWLEKLRREGEAISAFLSPSLERLSGRYPKAVAFHQARILWDKEPFQFKELISKHQLAFDRITYKRCPRPLLPYRRPKNWRIPSVESVQVAINELIMNGEDVTFYKIAESLCCSYETLRKHECLNALIISYASDISVSRLRRIPT